jgi:dihydroorotate dehydrogenase
MAKLWGQHLPNPIGLAAGFDKDGDAIAGLYDLGFGWVEIGSVTPKYQVCFSWISCSNKLNHSKQGNPHPRVFRLLDDSAIINRYGFPSQGHSYVVARLLAWCQSNRGSRRLLSVNLGKNKSSPPDSISDFLTGIRTFAPMAPVIVINVSSPNTPGLRALQARGLLEELLAGAIEERNAVANATGTRARLVLKIAPDLTEEAVADLADVVRNNGVDGVIVSNTTVDRPDSLISRMSYNNSFCEKLTGML